MDAISSCRILGLDHSLCSTTNTHINIKPSFSSLPCSQLLRPNVALRRADFALPRLRISNRRNTGVEQRFRAPRISCLSNDECKETESVSEDSQQEASIDLKLPRRSLLVTFTCDACGVRSQRLINRLAYERGLVYVQCSGCSQYHKLVDNLGLVIEYNLQEEIHSDANMDQV